MARRAWRWAEAAAWLVALVGCAEASALGLPDSVPTQPNIAPLPIGVTPAASPTVSLVTVIPPGETLAIPLPTPYPDTPTFSIGRSVEGREISAWNFGEGSTTLVLVGGIHAGYEANTVWLSNLLVQHFQKNPADVLPETRLIIIPLANPDGILRGSGPNGRMNARGVDLNRNWGCEWEAQAVWGDIPVDPGPRPFSEPETVALRRFFIETEPDAVVFYHSSLSGVYLGGCRGRRPGAEWLGDLLAQSTGYRYEPTFAYYEVSGDATNWLAERGVPAAVIELSVKDDPEFRQNLNGVIALQCHFVFERVPDAARIPAVQRLCGA